MATHCHMIIESLSHSSKLFCYCNCCLDDRGTVALKETRPITNEMHYGMKVIANSYNLSSG